MNGPAHYLVSAGNRTAAIELEAGLKDIIAEETSPQELRIKRWGLGTTSVLLLSGSVIASAIVAPDVVGTMTHSLRPQNLDVLTDRFKEGADIVGRLGFAGLTGWMGLEFGNLALKSHKRLQSLDESHSN